MENTPHDFPDERRRTANRGMNRKIPHRRLCHEIERELDSYISKELKQPGRDLLLDHLKICQHCSSVAAERMFIKQSLQLAVRRITAPSKLGLSIRERLRSTL